MRSCATRDTRLTGTAKPYPSYDPRLSCNSRINTNQVSLQGLPELRPNFPGLIAASV